MPSATVHNRRAGRVMFPDQPHPSRVPYAAGGTVPWDTLTERQQDQVRAWLTEHGVDPARVVVGGLFAYDEATDEWRIEIQAHRDGLPYVRPGARFGAELATVVRRVWARSRDFGRKRGRGGRLILGPATRVEVNGVDLAPYLADAEAALQEQRREHRRAR